MLGFSKTVIDCQKLLQALLMPPLLSALCSMAALQYDPGQKLMEAGAHILAQDTNSMSLQARLRPFIVLAVNAALAN